MLWCGVACAQTPVYPGAVATDSQLKVGVNGVATLLTAQINANQTTIPVSACARIVANVLITIDNEIMPVTGCVGTIMTVGARGFDSTTATAHHQSAQINAYVDAWHHNALSAEVKAIEGALGPNLVNVSGTAAAGIRYQYPGGAVQTVQSKLTQYVTTIDFGAKCDGSDDTAAFNAALAVAANGPELYVTCPSTVTAVHLPNAGNAHVVMRFAAGATMTCIGAGNDCVSSVTGVFANPTYDIEGMTLVGPDTLSGNPAAPCATTISGHGLRISGAATPRVTIRNLTATGFCGSGKFGLWLDNVEDSTLSNIQVQLNYGGFRASNAFNANVVNGMLAGQNSNYGVYISNSQNSVFNSLNVQSNATVGLLCDACIAMQFNGPHLENNNVANVANLCTWNFDALTGYSISNALYYGQLQGSHDRLCTNATAPWTNTGNKFTGGLTSSLSVVDVSNAPLQSFDGFRAQSGVVGANNETIFMSTGNSQYENLQSCFNSSIATPCYSFAGVAGSAATKSGLYHDGTNLFLVSNGIDVMHFDGSANTFVGNGPLNFNTTFQYISTPVNKWLLYDGASTGNWFVLRDQLNNRQAITFKPGTGGATGTGTTNVIGRLYADSYSSNSGGDYSFATLPNATLMNGGAVICIDCTAATPTLGGGSIRWVFSDGTQWRGN